MACRTANQAWSKGLDAVHTVNSNSRTANVANFQSNIQLSRFTAYPDGSLSQSIRSWLSL